MVRRLIGIDFQLNRASSKSGISSETNFLWHQDEELEVVAGVPEQKESAA